METQNPFFLLVCLHSPKPFSQLPLFWPNAPHSAFQLQMHHTVCLPNAPHTQSHSVPSNFHLFAKCCSSRGCTQQAAVAYFDRTVTDQRTFFHALQNLPAMQCVRPNKNCPSQILQPFCPNRLWFQRTPTQENDLVRLQTHLGFKRRAKPDLKIEILLKTKWHFCGC